MELWMRGTRQMGGKGIGWQPFRRARSGGQDSAQKEIRQFSQKPFWPTSGWIHPGVRCGTSTVWALYVKLTWRGLHRSNLPECRLCKVSQ